MEEPTATIATSKELKVKVYSPFKTYFDGTANSISAENDTGVFDVLFGHHNFLTLLNPCDLSIKVSGRDDEKISITRGLMHVRKDSVDVFLDV
jgi:F0F1-type ATP synthase epsilon subunit